MANGNRLRFDEYAVYNEDQVYPMFLIRYNLDPDGWYFQMNDHPFWGHKWLPYLPR